MEFGEALTKIEEVGKEEFDPKNFDPAAIVEAIKSETGKLKGEAKGHREKSEEYAGSMTELKTSLSQLMSAVGQQSKGADEVSQIDVLSLTKKVEELQGSLSSYQNELNQAKKETLTEQSKSHVRDALYSSGVKSDQALSDAVDYLTLKYTFVKNSAGELVSEAGDSVDSLIEKYVNEREYLKVNPVVPGSGASGVGAVGAKGIAEGKTAKEKFLAARQRVMTSV
jgi:hypothetical protein